MTEDDRQCFSPPFPTENKRLDICDMGCELHLYVVELYWRGLWREHRNVALALDSDLWRVRGFRN